MTDERMLRRAQGRPSGSDVDLVPRLTIEPFDTSFSFKNRAYAALKNVIVSMDIYRNRSDIRLDERQLAQDFGVSRTPVREAMAQLEREGFVRSVPRRGVYIVRKTRAEVIEMITAWAALESMAARLITEKSSGEDIASLRKMFATFEDGALRAHLDVFIDDTLSRCTRCGKCFEACPMTRYSDGLTGADPKNVVSGVLDWLKQTPGVWPHGRAASDPGSRPGSDTVRRCPRWRPSLR